MGCFVCLSPEGKKKEEKNEAHNYVITVGGVLVSYVLLYIYINRGSWKREWEDLSLFFSLFLQEYYSHNYLYIYIHMDTTFFFF